MKTTTKDTLRGLFSFLFVITIVIGIGWLMNTLSEDTTKNTVYRWDYRGIITSLRIDDDADYHFSTDYKAYNDIYNHSLYIERSNCKTPSLYVKQSKYKNDEWIDGYEKYKIILPIDYKIETFDD